MRLPTLAELVAALRSITRAKGPLHPGDFVGLEALLPRDAYSSAPDAFAALREDLLAVIGALPDENDRIIAEFLFRQREPNLNITARHEKIMKNVQGSDSRQIRGPRENYVMGQVAFGLYTLLASPLRAGSPVGDGYVFSRFEIDTFVHDADWSVRTIRNTFSIHTLRAMVEFYKFGTEFPRSTVIGHRLIADDRRQRLVGTTPVDVEKPDGAHWYIVQFAPQLAFRTDATIVIEEDVQLGGDARQQEARLDIAALAPIARLFGVAQSAILRVHAPRSLVPEYDRRVYSDRAAKLGRPTEIETVSRADDSPMTYPIPDPQEDTCYKLTWSIVP